MADKDDGAYAYVYPQPGERPGDVEARTQAVYRDASVTTYELETDWAGRGAGESDVRPLTFPVTSVIRGS